MFIVSHGVSCFFMVVMLVHDFHHFIIFSSLLISKFPCLFIMFHHFHALTSAVYFHCFHGFPSFFGRFHDVSSFSELVVTYSITFHNFPLCFSIFMIFYDFPWLCLILHHFQSCFYVVFHHFHVCINFVFFFFNGCLWFPVVFFQ